jgi:flagellar biosynthesis GTPase FlhF
MQLNITLHALLKQLDAADTREDVDIKLCVEEDLYTMHTAKRKPDDSGVVESSMKMMRVNGAVLDEPGASDLMEWEMPSTNGHTNHGSSGHEDLSTSHDSDNFSFESIGCNLEDVNMELATKFDVKVLQNSVEASALALELVRGKDVVMIVGKTGVGKR